MTVAMTPDTATAVRLVVAKLVTDNRGVTSVKHLMTGGVARR